MKHKKRNFRITFSANKLVDESYSARELKTEKSIFTYYYILYINYNVKDKCKNRNEKCNIK